MKKKIIMVLAMVLLAFSASASDWTPLITNLDIHPEILWGFCPVYIEGGVSYDGFELIEDRETRLQLIVGGGYGQRKLWQDPVTGESTEKIWDQPLTYDVGFANWALKFIQGFWESPWDPGSDLLQLSVAYEGRYEYNMDSRVAGETRANFGDPKEVLTLDQFLGKEGSSVYPDLLGNRQYLGTNFNLNLKFDLMTDEIIENDGILLELDLNWSPYALNHALGGEADFYSIAFEAVGAKTIFSLRDACDLPYSPQLLLIFFGRISEGDNLHRFLENTERIICILSEHSGQGVNTGRKGSAETERFLHENGIRYSKESFEIPFPQPLLSLSEAEKFIEQSYGRKFVDTLIPFAEKAEGRYPLILRNDKKCTLFDIRKEES